MLLIRWLKHRHYMNDNLRKYLGYAVGEIVLVIVGTASVALYSHYLPRIREVLGPEEARRARRDGRAMAFDAALAYLLEGLG